MADHIGSYVVTKITEYLECTNKELIDLRNHKQKADEIAHLCVECEKMHIVVYKSFNEVSCCYSLVNGFICTQCYKITPMCNQLFCLNPQ